MFNKFIRKNNIKYYLILTGVLLFMFVGCSSSNLEKIKEKTKDIKKEDLEEIKKKIKKIVGVLHLHHCLSRGIK